MNSLFTRNFVSFLAAITLIVVASIGALIWTASSVPQSIQAPRVDQMRDDVENVLHAYGMDGLKAWVALKNAGSRIFYIEVLDTKGTNLTQRFPLPHEPPDPNGEFRAGKLKRGASISRPVVDRDGTTYAMIVYIPPISLFGMLGQMRHALTVIALTLAVGIPTCFVLARSLSRPILQLRRATHRVAEGNLDVAIPADLSGRRDEVGQLARDFDVMSRSVRRLLQSKQELVRDISHELRSPMTRLRMAVALVQQSPDNQDFALRQLERQITRLDVLISQLLQLSTLEDTHLQPASTVVPLGDLLRELVQDSTVEQLARNLAVVIECGDELVLQGDRELIRSAIDNVLRNALRYSPDNETVHVTARRENASIVVCIADRGAGVAPHLLDKIFEPLYRVDPAREGRSGGNGVGLAIVRQVLLLHRGSASAANADSGGLIVTLRWPDPASLPSPAPAATAPAMGSVRAHSA